jgi:hypothetical protein
VTQVKLAQQAKLALLGQWGHRDQLAELAHKAPLVKRAYKARQVQTQQSPDLRVHRALRGLLALKAQTQPFRDLLDPKDQKATQVQVSMCLAFLHLLMNCPQQQPIVMRI